MADYVRRRMIAARVGISAAVLGLLGGWAAKERTDGAEPVESDLAATISALERGSVGTRQVRDRSLLFRDFKRRQIYSLRQVDALFLKRKAADDRFLKITDASLKYLKIADAGLTFLKIAEANAAFLKIADANQTFLKLDGTAVNSQSLGGLPASQFVQGQGSVISSALTLTEGGQETPLLVVPGFFQVDAHTNDGPGYILRNISGGTMRIVKTDTDTTPEPAESTELAPGQSDTEFFGGNTGNSTIQVVPAAGGRVGTFTVSWMPAGAFPDAQFIGQALIGTP